MTESHELFDAIAACDAESVRRILKARPELAQARDSRGVSAILQAHYRKDPNIVAALLQAKPELDVFDSAALGNTRRLQELLAQRDDLLQAHSADGWTPLHLASFFGRVDAVRYLLEAGAEVGAVSGNELANTPLHAAAAARHLEVCRLLLTHGADPDARQHGGYTALQSAALHGDRELVDLLLQHGADPSATDEDGEGPVDYADRGGHREIVALLKSVIGNR